MLKTLVPQKGPSRQAFNAQHVSSTLFSNYLVQAPCRIRIRNKFPWQWSHVTVSTLSAIPRLYRSVDGGKTWQFVTRCHSSSIRIAVRLVLLALLAFVGVCLAFYGDRHVQIGESPASSGVGGLLSACVDLAPSLVLDASGSTGAA